MRRNMHAAVFEILFQTKIQLAEAINKHHGKNDNEFAIIFAATHNRKEWRVALIAQKSAIIIIIFVRSKLVQG